MAEQAEGPHVFEIALAAAFGNRHRVIRIPQRTALPRLQPPSRPRFNAARSRDAAQPANFALAVEPAYCANSVVAGEQLLAKIAGIAPKFPLVYAPFGTEGEPSGRDLQIAPPAECPAV
jgi:hypothetical protein